MAKYTRCVIQVQRDTKGQVSKVFGLPRSPTKGGVKRAMHAAQAAVRTHPRDSASVVLLCPNKPERIVFKCSKARRATKRGGAVRCKPIRSHGPIYRELAKGVPGVMDRGQRRKRR